MNRLCVKFRVSGRDGLFAGPAGDVFRGMATLAVGTGAARIIGIVSIPFLTRIYSPEDYGILAVFTSLVTMLVPFLTLRYVVAIPLPRTDGLAMNLMALNALLLLIMTGIVFALLWAFGPFLLEQLSMEVLAPWWPLIALGMLGTGTYEVLSMWATRQRAYKIIAKTQFTQSSMGEAMKIGLGLLAVQQLGLILGQITAQSGGVVSFLMRFRADFQRLRRQISWQRMGLMARYHRAFPIYRLPSQVLLVFSMQAPLLFTAALFDTETTGQLGLALMALALPINLIGTSMATAYYAEITKLRHSPNQIKTTTLAVQKRLFLIGLPIAISLVFFGKAIFALVFGPNWTVAGHFASILSVYMLLQFTSAPLMQVLNVYNKQSSFLIINFVRTIGLLVLFWIARQHTFSPEAFMVMLSGLLFCFYGLISAYILLLVSNQARQYLEVKSKP